MYDRGHYMKLVGNTDWIVRPDSLSGSIELHAFLGYPILSGPVISPVEFSCVRVDGTYGRSCGSAYLAWDAKDSIQLVDGLSDLVLTYLDRLAGLDLCIDLFSILMSHDRKFPPNFDSDGVRRGAFPARLIGLAGCLTIAGRYAEAARYLAMIPPALEINGKNRMAADISTHRVEIDKDLLDYQVGLSVREGGRR